MNNIESNLNDIISDILAEAIIINEAKNGVRPNGGIRGLLAGLKRARSQKNKSQARRYERALDKMGYDYRKKKGGASKKSDGFNGSSKEEMRHMNEDDYYDYDDDYEYDDYDYMDEGWLGDKLKAAKERVKNSKTAQRIKSGAARVGNAAKSTAKFAGRAAAVGAAGAAVGAGAAGLAGAYGAYRAGKAAYHGGKAAYQGAKKLGSTLRDKFSKKKKTKDGFNGSKKEDMRHMNEMIIRRNYN